MSPTPTKRIESGAQIQWVGPLDDLRVDLRAQRALRPNWVDKRIPVLDIDGIGIICVNRRTDNHLYIIDGQHRVALLRGAGWGDQKVQAEVFHHLSLEAEAKEFLRRNDRLSMQKFELFRASLTAQEPEAIAINNTIMGLGLRIDQQSRPGSVNAVSALEWVFRGAGVSPDGGARALASAIRVLRDCWGIEPAAFDGQLIRGVGMITAREGSALDEALLVKKLATFPGGAPGVLGAARGLRQIRSAPVATCVANVMVDVHNKGRRTKTLGAF